MVTVELKTFSLHLAEYLELARAGETVIIAEGESPIAEFKLTGTTPPASRPFGMNRGEFTIPDDFDEPLPEEILQSFEGA